MICLMILQKKIIWLLSYDLLDLSFVNNFLNYYLSKPLKHLLISKYAIHYDHFAKYNLDYQNVLLLLTTLLNIQFISKSTYLIVKKIFFFRVLCIIF